MEFKAFRALADVTVPLSRLTVIVGPNGCGKTTVLEGIELLGDLSVPAPREIGNLYGRMHTWVDRWPEWQPWLTSPGTSPVEIRAIDTQESEVISLVAYPPPPGGRPTFDVKSAVAGDLHLPVSKLEEADTYFKVLTSEAPIRSRILRLDVKRLAAPSYSEGLIPVLAQDGEGLASVLNHLAGNEPERLDRIRADLQRIVPQARKLRTPRAQVTLQRFETLNIDQQRIVRPVSQTYWGHRVEVEMGQSGFLPASVLSEGTMRTLGLLTALHSLDNLDRPGGTILIDDLDQTLHPRAQAELVRVMREVMRIHPHLQVVCTSHSPYLLDAFEEDEIVVMALDANGHAVAKRITDHPEWGRWKGMLALGEFWSTVGDDWVKATTAPAA